MYTIFLAYANRYAFVQMLARLHLLQVFSGQLGTGSLIAAAIVSYDTRRRFARYKDKKGCRAVPRGMDLLGGKYISPALESFRALHCFHELPLLAHRLEEIRESGKMCYR